MAESRGGICAPCCAGHNFKDLDSVLYSSLYLNSHFSLIELYNENETQSVRIKNHLKGDFENICHDSV